MPVPLLTQAQLIRHVRSMLPVQLYDESGIEPAGTAIYTLSDPRDIRQIRYVGQTRSPQRRYLQHLATARLWLPDELPWWVQKPELRSLYEWIRALYSDERRLPVMVVCNWIDNAAHVRSAERKHIVDCLQQRMPLLNIESEMLGRQGPLL